MGYPIDSTSFGIMKLRMCGHVSSALLHLALFPELIHSVSPPVPDVGRRPLQEGDAVGSTSDGDVGPPRGHPAAPLERTRRLPPLTDGGVLPISTSALEIFVADCQNTL